MVRLYIYFISDLHNGWTKYKTKWSEAGTINARLDEIEKKQKKKT